MDRRRHFSAKTISAELGPSFQRSTVFGWQTLRLLLSCQWSGDFTLIGGTPSVLSGHFLVVCTPVIDAAAVESLHDHLRVEDVECYCLGTPPQPNCPGSL